ncbi:TlpA family protein disulfide reductase [Winogradskyella immobilis]|nr:TlpA disulfide reductase family protein [Winogradskyella immobilis]
MLHKGLSYINSASSIDVSKRESLENYNWKLLDESGSIYDLNDAKGKVIVINFWATWCPPCIAEMPSLEKLYVKYKEDVVFLFVTNEDKELTTKFKENKNYTFPSYQPVTDGLFEVKSIPRTFVIDKKGKIAIDKSGALDWFSTSIQEEIKTLLKS